MAKDDKELIKDQSGKIPMPQYKDATTGDLKLTRGNHAPFNQLLDETGNIVGKNNPMAVQLSGSNAQDVTLQNAVSAAGNGTAHAPTADVKLRFEITGTSTSRTVNFEIAGISGVFVPVTAFNINDPTIFGNYTTNGSNTAPDSWEVDIPVGWSFRARVSAVAGGNVSVKGKSKAVI